MPRGNAQLTGYLTKREAETAEAMNRDEAVFATTRVSRGIDTAGKAVALTSYGRICSTRLSWSPCWRLTRTLRSSAQPSSVGAHGQLNKDPIPHRRSGVWRRRYLAPNQLCSASTAPSKQADYLRLVLSVESTLLSGD